MHFDDSSHHGWINNCQPVWGVNPFPDDLLEIFLDDKIHNEKPDEIEFLSFDSSCDEPDHEDESESQIFL